MQTLTETLIDPYNVFTLLVLISIENDVDKGIGNVLFFIGCLCENSTILRKETVLVLKFEGDPTLTCCYVVGKNFSDHIVDLVNTL